MDDLIELDALSDSARKVLDGHQDRLQLLKDPAWLGQNEQKLYQTSAELGWLGLCVGEPAGGLGQPFSALGALYVELGRALAGPSIIATTVGLELLSAAADEPDVTDLIEATIAGDQRPLALIGGRVAVKGQRQGARIVLRGTARDVLGAEHATHLLIPVEAPHPAVALVKVSHPGLVIEVRKAWDLTRGQVFDVSFEQLELPLSSLILQGDTASQALLRAAAHFDLALACDAIGGSDQILSETLAYMQTRTQFGRTIASFQALKHRCADLATDIEVARALVNSACQSTDGALAWRTQAAACRLHAGAVYRRVTEDAVQLHGGIGFTWEHSCHLFLKRARLNDALGGTPEQRKDQVAPHILAAAARRAAH